MPTLVGIAFSWESIMWNDNGFTQLLGLRYPIVQGPFGGGLSSVELTVTVTEAGGLGSFGVHHLSGQQIRDVAAEIRARTRRAFALNLWMPVPGREHIAVSERENALWRQHFQPYFDELGVPMPSTEEVPRPSLQEQMDAVLAAEPTVFSFVFGVPPPAMLHACRDARIVTCGTATTAAEARLLAEAGVDCIVATGFEAGGHRVSFLREPEYCLTGLMALIPQVADAVTIPVIAAGGIADGRGIRAALALGAQGVQIGTAFLACDESNVSTAHRHILFSAEAHDTVLTKVFSGRLARGVRNRMAIENQGVEAQLPGYPAHTWFMSHLKAAAIQQHRPDVMALWCGQSAALLEDRKAEKLMRRLVAEMDSG